MASPTQICNLSLSWLGQNLINDLNDDQNEAKIMKANYGLSRDKVLNDGAWTFALSRQILAPDATAPDFGESARFLIPSNVIFVHRVYRATGVNVRTMQSAEWEREGQYILASESALRAIFVVKVTNTALFSPAFVHALAARMAADTAMTFTENDSLETKMEKRYQDKLDQALFADGRQGRSEIVRSSKLTGVRSR